MLVKVWDVVAPVMNNNNNNSDNNNTIDGNYGYATCYAEGQG